MQPEPVEVASRARLPLPPPLRRWLKTRIKLARQRPWRIVVFLAALVPLLGLGYLAHRVYFVMDSRIKTFHELEMYEGDMTLHAVRILDGKPLYPRRDGDYIPLLYTPFYSYLQALAMKFVDDPKHPHTLYSGRIVSVLALWGILLVLMGWIWRETKSWLAMLSAAGFFTAIDPYVGWWFDLARVDVTHVFLLGLGSWAFLDRRSKSDGLEILKGIVGGLFFTLGFFTKQTAGQIAVVLTPLAFLICPLRAIWGAAAGLTFGGIGMIYFNVTNPDFWYLTVSVPSNHNLDLGNWQKRLVEDVFRPATIPLTVVAAWGILAVIRRRWHWALGIPALAAASYFSCRGALTIGGYVNHYLPMWFFIVLYFGMAVGSIMPVGKSPPREIISLSLILLILLMAFTGILIFRRYLALEATLAAAIIFVGVLRHRPVPRNKPWRARVSLVPVLVLILACLDLFHCSRVKKIWPDGKGGNPEHPWTEDQLKYHVPGYLGDEPKYVENGRNLLLGISQLDGNVWIPHANYYAYLVGRPTDVSLDHVRDVAVSGQPVSPYALGIINGKKYKYILLNDTIIEHDWLEQPIRSAIVQNYELKADWQAKFGWLALRPVDSTSQKPRALMVRRGER